MADNGVQTKNGKAFEYACLKALNKNLSETQEISIEETEAFKTAKDKYDTAENALRSKLDKAAEAAVRVILRLEPQLLYPNNNVPLFLSIQTDAAGIGGDVRDVLCMRRQNQWEIGLSCKHNHHAVKHSRLSDTIDFGKEWFDIPCSQQYFSEVVPLFNELRTMRDEAKEQGSEALWSDIADKAERYYIPILQSFMDELKRLADANESIPERLINYLIGRNDFYKVIADDTHQFTRVEAVNIAGTLNKISSGHTSMVNIARVHLPKRFYHIGFKPNSENTIEVICDEGWNVSMRIHNASSKVEPSLKFDVNLISTPNSIHTQNEPW